MLLTTNILKCALVKAGKATVSFKLTNTALRVVFKVDKAGRYSVKTVNDSKLTISNWKKILQKDINKLSVDIDTCVIN